MRTTRRGYATSCEPGWTAAGRRRERARAVAGGGYGLRGVGSRHARGERPAATCGDESARRAGVDGTVAGPRRRVEMAARPDALFDADAAEALLRSVRVVCRDR